MMNKVLMFVLCALLLCAAPVLARQSSGFEQSDCPFAMPDGETAETIQCGYLTVPEDHSAPQGTQIRLAVAILASIGDSPAPDPIVYLAGGPGAGALDEVESWVEYPLRENRDIILFDQRGTGYSEPALNCDSSEDAQACHDKLVSEGVNLSDYNSIQSAQDVTALREALGYDEWNLYGVSYGTRLSLVVLRDQPQGVRSVVLDSVYPPQVNDWDEQATDAANAFDTLFKGCAASATCNEAYPNLEDVFYQTVDQLNSSPVEDGDNSLTGDSFSEQVFQALYGTDNIPYLPMVIYAVSEGDYTLLDDLNSGAILDNARRQDEESGSADGMFNSVTCSEEVPFANFDKGIADAEAARPELTQGAKDSIQSMYDTCAIWDVTPAPAIEAQAVSSDVPTLILEGQYDPVTPVAWGQLAAKTLSNSFFFSFPGVGHGVIDAGDCPSTIVAAFIDDPASEPDGSCIADMPEPDFVTGS